MATPLSSAMSIVPNRLISMVVVPTLSVGTLW
jgi:hypothetical protein